jgi:hypothetical protein
VEMNLHKYQVSVTFNGEAVSDGDTVHVKQNDSATFTYTIDEGAGADGATVKLDSKWLTLTPGEGNAVTGFNIIGNHLVKVVYSEGTGDDEIEQVVFTFNVFVVYNDIGFIVPDPGMVVTLTG